MRLDQEIAELAQVSLEEVFENDPHARAEYEAQCDIWRDEAIAAQDRETVTINGNTYVVNNDPKHQRRQRAGYCGRNPK
jgi:hypothetical protein